jgi:hypothetical protein
MNNTKSISTAFRKKTLMHTSLIIGSLLIAGCSIPKIDLSPSTSYLLNPENGKFCAGYEELEKKGACQDLKQVAFNVFDTKEIENIYQQKISGSNRTASLIKIIIQGDNLDYQPTLLENGLYKLPINQQTNTVWRVLKKISDPNNIVGE